MENKQTAVDWLFEQIFKDINTEFVDKLKAKAKAMEKEQIKDAWLSGQDDGATICTPNQHYPDEEFYNKTYAK